MTPWNVSLFDLPMCWDPEWLNHVSNIYSFLLCCCLADQRFVERSLGSFVGEVGLESGRMSKLVVLLLPTLTEKDKRYQCFSLYVVKWLPRFRILYREQNVLQRSTRGSLYSTWILDWTMDSGLDHGLMGTWALITAFLCDFSFLTNHRQSDYCWYRTHIFK